MAKNSSLKSTGKMIKLVIMMNSKSGTTIPEIMKTLSVSRATAFRMKKAAVEALKGRAEYDFEPYERDETNEHRFVWRAKKLTGKGRDWTYRVYSPGRPLVFNDVGIETIRALKTAHAHLMTGGLLHEAQELTLLLSQVNDRLQLRAGTGAPAEAILEASGIGTRVSQRVQADPDTLRAIQTAIMNDRAIRFRYWLRSSRESRTYRVDPLGVIFHRFAYLVCIRHDGRRKGPVTFRIDEMSRVEELSAHRANRTKFDLHEFAQQSFGAFFGEEPLSVIWRFSPAKADEAEKFIFHPSQTQSREADGSLLVSFTAKGSVEMCWELFQWGRGVEIVAPERLKREYIRLSAEIAESAKRYESAQS
jgi:predicted DNA-binding transcriptional regulator YafY